ncbi:hypothetical protein B0T18DRAFT_415425 [Schizothecium vesticola]|uniref:Lysine-specific metallo-endopeptidase domain-containing protein n=1 Tax=Schizothecium vesticola TaxID=314040 RepID=A0AA40EQC6_9PEZI|nr:hypothetical protein B0T18DRAFT_415425 [Schizothecium vesticola]
MMGYIPCSLSCLTSRSSHSHLVAPQQQRSNVIQVKPSVIKSQVCPFPGLPKHPSAPCFPSYLCHGKTTTKMARPRYLAAFFLIFLLRAVSTTPLLVTLFVANDNTTLQVNVKNVAAYPIKILAESLALDDLALDHNISAFCNGRKVDFARIHFTRMFTSHDTDVFITLLPNQTMSSDPSGIASLNVLGSASCFISSQGNILALPETDTPSFRKKIERIPYATKEIHVLIHNKMSAELRIREIGAVSLDRRAAIRTETSCSVSQKTSMESAFTRAGKLAAYARDQLRQNKNPKRIYAYWLQDKQKTLDFIASKYELIRIYATNKLIYYEDGPKLHYTCKDEWKKCNTQSGIIAYAYPILQPEGSRRYVVIVTCPIFWQMELQLKRCPGKDRGSSMVHELSHALIPTFDKAYGEAAIKSTSPNDRLVNAENYELFAHDAEAGCPATYDWPN